VECGLQIGPTDLHATFLNELEGRGWSLGEDVLVMAAETGVVATGAARAGRVAADAGPVIAGAANAGPVIAGAANAGPVAGGAGPGGAGAAAVGIGHGGLELDVADHATPEWVAAWAHCDRRPDIQDHLVHLFPRMAGIASFVWCGTSAVGISVELDGIVGLFCLAVDPDLRRRGLGKALVLSMLARHSAPLTYLQVFSRNIAGVALYRSLGFEEIYRYRHAVAPDVRARPPQSGPRPRGL
jgi:ribosomal protein S18 acetylase RimI-like enzyme